MRIDVGSGSRSASNNLLEEVRHVQKAIRLAIVFDTTPEGWMAQQAQHDLCKASKKRKALEKNVRA